MQRPLRKAILASALLASIACDRAPQPASRDAVAASAPAASPDSAGPGPGDTLTLRLQAGRDSGATDRAAGNTLRDTQPRTAVPNLRLADTTGGVDTADLRLYPAAPERGGVLLAVMPVPAGVSPRCAWDGRPLPCYSAAATVRAIVPLPADQPAGDFVLTISAAGLAVRRTVSVRDRDFGRQVVLLDSAHYALVRRAADIARDARAIRQVLAGESSVQHWRGSWLDPAAKTKSEGYGVERVYYRASDSSRALTIEAGASSIGAFGADTTRLASGATPSWRHAGIDVPLPRGAPVRAAAEGIIVDVSDYVLTGRTVVIDHGEGVHTAYFHLDTITVQRGENVQRGARIGRVGKTGLATGPHLHYGVYIHGMDVDPAAWHALPPRLLADTLPPPPVR